MTVTAYIGLGSNLGDRQGHLDAAISALNRLPAIEELRASVFWETAPVGGPPGQGHYLNAVVQIRTTLSPRELFDALMTVERQQGRVRGEERHAPRTLDLDLLLYGDAVINEPDLIVPHPRMHERTFVLGPLAEIAPNLFHPVLRQRMPQLLAQAASRPPLLGRRALVTGSSSGIGQAIALALADDGADVLIHANRSVDQGVIVAEQILARGNRSGFLQADLRDAAARERLVAEAWNRFDGFDIWVNNAGADTLTGEAFHWPFERKLEELLAVDVTATMLLSRAVGERMRSSGAGVLLNIGWDQATTGMEGDSGQLFGATKGAVMAFTKSLALSLAPEVRVNCLAPGWIRTAWGETASRRWQERVRDETPLRRWGTPQDVAAVARWLVSPAASYVTGQVIQVNGGAVR
jgi:2-amino-4-hydroxy-6-hydroxymethyldihydropteridine diphosphokinase